MTTEQQVAKQAKSQPVEGEAKPMQAEEVYLPATDIYERDDAIVLVADMPGVAEQDVDVHVENHVLTIQGAPAAAASSGEVLYAEFRPGRFERAFTLSNDIDSAAIQARMKNGVLTVELPKSAKARARKIEVLTE